MHSLWVPDVALGSWLLNANISSELSQIRQRAERSTKRKHVGNMLEWKVITE